MQFKFGQGGNEFVSSHSSFDLHQMQGFFFLSESQMDFVLSLKCMKGRNKSKPHTSKTFTEVQYLCDLSLEFGSEYIYMFNPEII